MNEFQKYLVSEFAEEYEEGRITRRQALRLILGVTGSLAAANAILAACTPASLARPGVEGGPTPLPGETLTPTSAASPTDASLAATQSPPVPDEASATAPPAVSGTVAPDDPAVTAGALEFPAGNESLLGYLARPSGDGRFAVVLVCHENRGLTAHIQDVTRRVAKAGYVGLAVDLLSRQGGTAALGSDAVPGALGNIDPDQFVADFRSGWEYLGQQGFTQAERVGMVGFCFGGGVTWRVATHMPELRAAVPFYGPHPPVSDIASIQAPVLAVYGGNDQRINQGIPAIEEAMRANNKVYEKLVYPNTDHAFHNDTGSRYNREAAQDAWARTLAWFERYL